MPRRSDYALIALLSGALLAFELLLLRLFGLTQWHHFASLAVSLALLGFGAAGTVLTLLGARTAAWGDRLQLAATLGVALTMLGVLALNQTVAVRPLFAVWNSLELGRLLLLDFAAFLPFFFGALAIGQAFVRWPAATRKLYAANMLGSGAGSLAAVALLMTMGLLQALLIVPAALLAGLACQGWMRAEERRRRRSRLVAACSFLLLVALALAWPRLPALPRLSDFTPLAYLLDLPQAQVLQQHHGLHATATVVRADSHRPAPGLSLQWFELVPVQDALVLEASRAMALPRDPAAPPPGFLRATLAAAPYELLETPAVLLLGTDEGQALPLARLAGARRIVWIEPNPAILAIAAARGMTPAAVEVRRDDPRRALARKREKFDLIVFGSTAVEGDALGESPLMTVEGIRQALALASDNGFVAIPYPISNPPRWTPKLLRMARLALERHGAAEPAVHIAGLRAMRQGLIVLSPRPLAPAAAATLRGFGERWGFDPIWFPGLDAQDSNRHVRLAEPIYFAIASAELQGGGKIPAAAAMFDTAPASDPRPYFWHTMRWSALPDLLRRLGRPGLIYLDWAALMLAVTMTVASLLAALLILAPLGRLPPSAPPLTRRRVLLYFTGLGLGYLIVEMAAFQRAVLVLGQPVSAAAVVFATFLIGSGVGSLSAPRDSGPRIVGHIFLPLAGCGLLAVAGLWLGGEWLWRLPWGVRAAVIALLLAPLAWAMGRPFPWGLSRVTAQPPLVPWAWGINGFASVLAAPLATLISVQAGQHWTWLAGALCYGVAAGAARRHGF